MIFCWCVFRYNKNNFFVAILVYIDDLVILCDEIDGIHGLKNELKSLFEQKDLGQLKYYSDVSIERKKKEIVNVL